MYLYQGKFSLGLKDQVMMIHFLIFFDRTTLDEYKSALVVESMGCCMTTIEYAKLNGIEKKT